MSDLDAGWAPLTGSHLDQGWADLSQQLGDALEGGRIVSLTADFVVADANSIGAHYGPLQRFIEA